MSSNTSVAQGALAAFFHDRGRAALTLSDPEDPEILPDFVGAEVDWRLWRLGMRNTAVGIGGAYRLDQGNALWRGA
ncbi:hypothetical protein AMJ39_09030 [candidate division TA06 bacterium DG_24]|uniref:Uncharacterized protein n=1 Tax=candidate division TA06 bacterium DG_24 TaxID=1703770 RepID=A0A0S7WP61_UNCT6|nr:MAG: hypothetical protein AMJ39_09030 [candidate division TA06 bacterium DG_24]